MICEKAKARSIKETDFHAEIKTDFRYATLGSVFGVIFNAEVVTDVGTHKLEYVFHDCDVAMQEYAKQHPRASKAYLN